MFTDVVRGTWFGLVQFGRSQQALSFCHCLLSLDAVVPCLFVFRRWCFCCCHCHRWCCCRHHRRRHLCWWCWPRCLCCYCFLASNSMSHLANFASFIVVVAIVFAIMPGSLNGRLRGSDVFLVPRRVCHFFSEVYQDAKEI